MKRLLFFSFLSVLLAALNSCDDDVTIPPADEYHPEVTGVIRYDAYAKIYVFELGHQDPNVLNGHGQIDVNKWGEIFYISTEPNERGKVTASPELLDSLIAPVYDPETGRAFPFNYMFDVALCRDRYIDGSKLQRYPELKGKRVYGLEVLSRIIKYNWIPFRPADSWPEVPDWVYEYRK